MCIRYVSVAVTDTVSFNFCFIKKRYVNPQATEVQISRVSHYAVAFYALVMGLAGLIFFYIGVSMGWLYEFMGVVLGSAVVPIALCVTWKKANKWGCIVASVAGFIAGIVAWLITTSALNGRVINVTVSTLGIFVHCLRL